MMDSVHNGRQVDSLILERTYLAPDSANIMEVQEPTWQNQVTSLDSAVSPSTADILETPVDKVHVINTSRDPFVKTSTSDLHSGILNGQLVALKSLRPYANIDCKTARQNFDHEAHLWSQLRHPNVLLFLGIFFAPPMYPAMVSEFMTNGTLVDYLSKHPDADRVHLLSGVACGLSYIHHLPVPILHGDIRGMNVLVDRHGKAVLADFGCARALHPPGTPRVTQSLNTLFCVRWASPENLETSQFPVTEKADVYSFACLCIEVFTGKLPFDHLINDGAVVIEVLVRNGRPPRPRGPAARQLNEAIWEMMEMSWALDPAHRPHMNYVHHLLSSL